MALIFQRLWAQILSCDHDLSVLFTLGWLVDPLGLCSAGGGGTRVGSYWRSFRSRRGLRLLLPDVSSLPSPSRLGWLVWAPCVALATKASEYQGYAEGYAAHTDLKLWLTNKSPLKVQFHNPGLMFEPAAWLGGALFCSRQWFWSVIWINGYMSWYLSNYCWPIYYGDNAFSTYVYQFLLNLAHHFQGGGFV